MAARAENPRVGPDKLARREVRKLGKAMQGTITSWKRATPKNKKSSRGVNGGHIQRLD